MPHNEGNRICFICESHYKELISDEDNKDLANVFLTAHRAHHILATYFYQYSIIHSTKNISKELVCSKKSKVLYSLHKNRKLDISHLIKKRIKSFQKVFDYKRKFKLFLKSFLINIKNFRIPFFPLRKNAFIINNKLSIDTAIYYDKSSYLRIFNFIEKDVIIPNEIKLKVTKILSEWCNICEKKIGLSCPESDKRVLIDEISEYLFAVYLLCENIKKIKVNKNTSFFNASGGSEVGRAFALSVLDNGGKVYGRIHDHRCEPLKRYQWPLYDLAVCSHYLVNTAQEEKNFEYLQINYPCPKKHAANIQSIDSPIIKNWRNIHCDKPFPVKTKTIMIVDSSVYPDKVPRFNLPAMVYIDLIFETISILNDLNYKTIYKRHPEIRKREKNDNLFSDITTVMWEPFEDVYQHADAFVFLNTTSSVFPFALCLNRPICLIENNVEPFFESAENLLRKRCNFVSTTRTKRGMLKICPDDLNLSVQPITSIDTEFISEYLYS